MKNYEVNVRRCEEIIKEAAELDLGKYIKNDVLIIRNDGGWVIGLMDGSEWIHCYEFDNKGFVRYEPMTHSDMDWALSVATTI